LTPLRTAVGLHPDSPPTYRSLFVEWTSPSPILPSNVFSSNSHLKPWLFWGSVALLNGRSWEQGLMQPGNILGVLNVPLNFAVFYEFLTVYSNTALLSVV